MQNDNQKIILKKLLYIYSKYLNKKKHLYFLKYHTIATKLSYLCTCKCSCLYPSLIKEFDSISLYKDSFQKNVGINFIDKDTTYNTKHTFSHDSSNANINQDFFSVKRDTTQNKSAYSNYINLNKSKYYVNGNEIGNISSFKINNFNNSMYINNKSKNNSKDKRYIVKIKLSNNKSIPNYYNKIFSDNNENNTSIIDYSNSIPNKSKKLLSEKGRVKHYSYKNIRIQRKLNNNQNVLRSNHCNHKDFIDPIKGIINDKIYDISYKDLPNQNKERNTKLIELDQKILEYLDTHNHEKENIIKKMKSQKVQYNKINTNPNVNNKDKVINLNNLNNYSYINNNYNYYCSDSNNGNNKSSILNRIHKYSYKNLNYSYNNNYNLPYQEKQRNKNSIYSNFLKKRVKRFENKKYPLELNYTNENINIENILYEDLINDNNNNDKEVDKNLESCRTSKNLMKIDYSNKNYYDNNKEIFPSDRYKIPIVVSKKSLSPSNISGKNDRNTVDNINYKRGNNNIFIDHYDTDRTPSSNISLKGCQSMKNMYKNKRYKNKITKIIKSKKINKNIIQKSLNLFFSNENANTIEDKLLSNNYKIDVYENKKNTKKNNDKKSKIGKIPNGTNHKKNNSFNPNSSKNSNINNKTNSNNSKILKVSSKVINEQFNKDKIEKKEASNSEKETESMIRFSVQSMNDSKMMELANKYIADEELNREEIMEILNSKKENNKEEK